MHPKIPTRKRTVLCRAVVNHLVSLATIKDNEHIIAVVHIYVHRSRNTCDKSPFSLPVTSLTPHTRWLCCCSRHYCVRSWIEHRKRNGEHSATCCCRATDGLPKSLKKNSSNKYTCFAVPTQKRYSIKSTTRTTPTPNFSVEYSVTLLQLRTFSLIYHLARQI